MKADPQRGRVSRYGRDEVCELIARQLVGLERVSATLLGSRGAHSAEHELKREHAQECNAGVAAHHPQLVPLERVELTKGGENTSVGEATAAMSEPIDGELNELAHDSVSMGRLPPGDKLVTNYDVL